MQSTPQDFLAFFAYEDKFDSVDALFEELANIARTYSTAAYAIETEGQQDDKLTEMVAERNAALEQLRLVMGKYRIEQLPIDQVQQAALNAGATATEIQEIEATLNRAVTLCLYSRACRAKALSLLAQLDNRANQEDAAQFH